jgi:hypothetical protein
MGFFWGIIAGIHINVQKSTGQHQENRSFNSHFFTKGTISASH